MELTDIEVTIIESLSINGQPQRSLEYGIYKHFKGKEYLVLHEAVDSEDSNKKLVVYQRLSAENRTIYVRPKDMFLSKVDKEKYPECKQEYRFEFKGYY